MTRPLFRRRCAALALVTLAETDDGCTIAAELGALPKLLAMSSTPGDSSAKRAAVAAITALARLEANREELAELRVTELLSALCSALEGGGAGGRLTAETALKLVRLCREGLGYDEPGGKGSSVRRAVGELGGISLFVSLLSSSAAPVQLAARARDSSVRPQTARPRPLGDPVIRRVGRFNAHGCLLRTAHC